MQGVCAGGGAGGVQGGVQGGCRGGCRGHLPVSFVFTVVSARPPWDLHPGCKLRGGCEEAAERLIHGGSGPPLSS